MKKYSLLGYAGLVQQTKARSTGSLVGVYACEQAGMAHDMPWATVCEAHSTVLGHESLRLARLHSVAPEEWCADCSGVVKTRQELPRPFSGPHYYDNESSCREGQAPCVLCGKGLDPTKCPMIRVVDGGGRFATADEPAEEAGDMGFFHIGPDCLRQHPGLKVLLGQP